MTRKYPPPKCPAKKIRYQTEQKATQGAEEALHKWGTEQYVYKCPGNYHWHTTSGGVHPKNLTIGRRIALLILQNYRVSYSSVFSTLDDSSQKSIGREISRMKQHGAITTTGNPPLITCLDKQKLLRILAVGTKDWIKEQGA